MNKLYIDLSGFMAVVLRYHSQKRCAEYYL